MFARLDRNSTNYASEVHSALRTISNEHDGLRLHQRIVVEYMQRTQQRGILIYHKMGSGKTLLAMALVIALLRTNERLIFIAKKSLHDNFRKSLRQYYDLEPSAQQEWPDFSALQAWTDKRFNFVTLNASNMLEQVRRAGSVLRKRDLNKSIVLWDEFHNFQNSVANGSANAIGVYDMVMRSECRVIGMTGTPVINHPYELAIGFNMISGFAIFGESYSDFIKYFVNNAQALEPSNSVDSVPEMRNREKFQDRITGLVSYYGAEALAQDFPVQYGIITESTPMSEPQFSRYSIARESELAETSRVQFAETRLAKPNTASSSYRVRTRQISNFYFPEHATTEERRNNRTRFEFHADRLRDTDFSVDALQQNSPKLLSLLYNIARHVPEHYDFAKLAPPLNKRTLAEREARAKKKNLSWRAGRGFGIVYSQYLDTGISLVAHALRVHGWTQIDNAADAAVQHRGPTFAVVSGDTAETRDEIIQVARSEKNKTGEIITLLLLSSAAAEGIDLLYGRHVHIFEPYWHWARIDQVLTRVVRYKSHATLPDTERTVQPYIYVAALPVSAKAREASTDAHLLKKAWQTHRLNSSFLRAMQSAALDCMIHYSTNCRLCAPTGRTLWRRDFHADMQEPSPCEAPQRVNAQPVQLLGQAFAYTRNPDKLYQKNNNVWHEVDDEIILREFHEFLNV